MEERGRNGEEGNPQPLWSAALPVALYDAVPSHLQHLTIPSLYAM